MTMSLEFVPTGIERILKKQSITAYANSTNVDEILRNHPNEVTREVSYLLYTLGYIEGKRAERAKRSK